VTFAPACRSHFPLTDCGGSWNDVLGFWGGADAGQTISPSSTAKRIDCQMVLAGFRLAKLLNDTLGRMIPADFK
jgi:hypothetical protein